MSRSRRLGAATALPAAALAAALVLAPTTAYAAEGDPAPVDASATGTAPTGTDSTGSDSTGSDSTVGAAAPVAVDPTTTDSPATSTGDGGAVTSGDDATGASGSGASPAEADVAGGDDAEPTDAEPTDDETAVAPGPVETAAPAEVAPADEVPVDEPVVFGDDYQIHPGTAAPVYPFGFTPGDRVTARVTGDDVEGDDGWITLSPSEVFDADGAATFFVTAPADQPVGGTVTVTVSDEHGRVASTDFVVTVFAPAPHLEAPTGATAGVVTIAGESGVAGGYAYVEVFDAEDFPTDDEPLQQAAAADEPADELDPVLVDVDPVPYETSGGAVTIVPVDATGHFSARFVLPAGDFAADAVSFDGTQTTISDFSDTILLSVAPAVTAPVASAPGTAAPGTTAPAALPVRPVAAVTPARSSSLAYTGSDPSGALGWAVASVLAGAGALVAGRLRLRLRRR
jgi:hypothetical protein